jgi:hypothetical protein
MHQYNVRAPVERITTDIRGPFPKTERGNQNLLTVTDNFIKWPEV